MMSTSLNRIERIEQHCGLKETPKNVYNPECVKTTVNLLYYLYTANLALDNPSLRHRSNNAGTTLPVENHYDLQVFIQYMYFKLSRLSLVFASDISKITKQGYFQAFLSTTVFSLRRNEYFKERNQFSVRILARVSLYSFLDSSMVYLCG